MKTYPIPMVPGPVKVPERVLDALRFDYGSGDLETEFLELYNQTEACSKSWGRAIRLQFKPEKACWPYGGR
jgi:aspartate aminotransferase-like enzyme